MVTLDKRDIMEAELDSHSIVFSQSPSLIRNHTSLHIWPIAVRMHRLAI